MAFNRELLAYLEEVITTERKEKFVEILKYRSKHFTVAVEDVFQLHNTSAVMRSCEVFGIQEIHVIEQRFGKRIDRQIAMGAQKWVDIHRYKTSLDCIGELRKKGYQIVATTPHKKSATLSNFDISKPSAIFFGTEKEGLSAEVMQEADDYLYIPMVGFTESLNISVSAAIIIQNLMQRLRESTIDWQLTEEEILEKRLDWTRKSIRNIDFIEKRYLEDNKLSNN
ncbi:MAG: RNA methyltransferase [Bacteroidota bacterium]|nr:RNA methyltransferase [Bacteroidota bacterium]